MAGHADAGLLGQWCPGGKMAALKRKHRLRWIVMVVAAPIVAMELNGFIVAWRAERIAGERPYCIQVAGPDAAHYTRATSFNELSFFNMQARLFYGGSGPPRAGNNHAILVLENPSALLNWSYWAEDFRPEVLNHEIFDVPDQKIWRPEINCAPVRHFARTLKFG